MTSLVTTNTEISMRRAVEDVRREFGTIRTGRASPDLLNRVIVDYYGIPTPVRNMATVTVPVANTIVIRPWEKHTLRDIEKAILKSDLGLTPANDGDMIWLTVPRLSGERRGELVKIARRQAEEGRVQVRAVRYEARKKIAEDKSLSEDTKRRLNDELQHSTDYYIKEIDVLLEAKEREITSP